MLHLVTNYERHLKVSTELVASLVVTATTRLATSYLTLGGYASYEHPWLSKLHQNSSRRKVAQLGAFIKGV